MNELLVLGVVVVALWLLFLWLRVPSALLFLSVLIGQLLATEVGEDAASFAAAVVRIDNPNIVKIALLLLPVILSIIFLRGKLSKSKLMIEAIPLLVTAAALVILALPILVGLQPNIESAQSSVDPYRSIILSCACVSILITTWLTTRSSGKHH